LICRRGFFAGGGGSFPVGLPNRSVSVTVLSFRWIQVRHQWLQSWQCAMPFCT
jgi:hypothetical protein